MIIGYKGTSKTTKFLQLTNYKVHAIVEAWPNLKEVLKALLEWPASAGTWILKLHC